MGGGGARDRSLKKEFQGKLLTYVESEVFPVIVYAISPGI